jgi:hypothetical protein
MSNVCAAFVSIALNKDAPFAAAALALLGKHMKVAGQEGPCVSQKNSLIALNAMTSVAAPEGTDDAPDPALANPFGESHRRQSVSFSLAYPTVVNDVLFSSLA